MAQPRTERKRLYNLPIHLNRRQMSSHLSGDLSEKYGRRSVVLRKGDTVKVMRGEFAGTVGKVIAVDTRTRKVEVEGVTVAKSDKTKVGRPVDPSNLLITKLDLNDRLRRAKLGASEADVDRADVDRAEVDRAPAPSAPAREDAAAEDAATSDAAAASEAEEAEEPETKKPVRGTRKKKGEAEPEEE